MNYFSQRDCAKNDINFTGFCSEFYPNGKIKWVKEFDGRFAVGVWMGFDEKGNLTKQINTREKFDSLSKIYSPKQVLEDEDFSTIKSEEIYDTIYAPPYTIYTFTEEEAKFNGNLNDYIIKNLVVPSDFNVEDFYGKIQVKFVVEMDGSISNYSVIKGFSELDREVIRLLKTMPAWIPAKNDGKTVRSWVQIPINICFK